MGYVAVTGGAAAIEASIERLKYERLRKGVTLDVRAVEAGMRALADQVMSEASLYDERMAAISIKQAEGSPEEAVFLMRAFRSTLPRSHYSLTVDPRAMRVERRISASFKDIPGGQILGASSDYTHRLIDSSLLDENDADAAVWVAEYLDRDQEKALGAAGPARLLSADPQPAEAPAARPPAGMPAAEPTAAKAPPASAIDYVRTLGLLKSLPLDDTEPRDVTKRALEFPASRSERLQILARGQTGAVTALGYAALRGYGALLHPTVGELRVGRVAVYVAEASAVERREDCDPGDAYYVGEIRMTVVETLVPVDLGRGRGAAEIEFELGFGASFGQNETKAIAMSLLDQSLEAKDKSYAAQDEEFVLLHVDSVEATGFISHLKLPHYVTFQSKLDSVRKSRRGA
ncbi:MAG: carbon-phosphorus lyase complex subunit PhnI [Rectinemataceae bacterium]